MAQKIKKTQIGAEWDHINRRPVASGGNSGTRRWLENQLNILVRQMIIHGYDPSTIKFRMDELPPDDESDSDEQDVPTLDDLLDDDGEIII